MEWLLSSSNCQLWNNPAHHTLLLWERGKWEREKLRQGSSSVLLKGRRPQISWAVCFIPHLIPLCHTLSCTIAISVFMGQGVVTENSPKNPFWQLCCHLPAPGQPTASPVWNNSPINTKHSFPSAGGRPVDFSGEEEGSAWLEGGRRPHFYNGRNCGENPEEDRMLSSPDMGRA